MNIYTKIVMDTQNHNSNRSNDKYFLLKELSTGLAVLLDRGQK